MSKVTIKIAANSPALVEGAIALAMRFKLGELAIDTEGFADSASFDGVAPGVYEACAYRLDAEGHELGIPETVSVDVTASDAEVTVPLD